MTMGIICAATLKEDGRRYIGKSKKSLQERRREHLKFARSTRGTSYFHRALSKYGAGAFEWEVLAECPDAELDGQEVAFIAVLRCNDPKLGFNMTAGGEGAKPTEEMRQKLSQKNRGRALTPDQRDRFLAAHWSKDPLKRDAIAEKARVRQAGVPLPPDHGSKATGRTLPEEVRRKMSESRTGKPKAKGYRLSAVTRRKMSEAHTGKPRGPMPAETKRKISEVKRLRNAARRV